MIHTSPHSVDEPPYRHHTTSTINTRTQKVTLGGDYSKSQRRNPRQIHLHLRSRKFPHNPGQPLQHQNNTTRLNPPTNNLLCLIIPFPRLNIPTHIPQHDIRSQIRVNHVYEREQGFVGHVAYGGPVCGAAEVEEGFDEGRFVVGEVGSCVAEEGFDARVKGFDFEFYTSFGGDVLIVSSENKIEEKWGRGGDTKSFEARYSKRARKSSLNLLPPCQKYSASVGGSLGVST